MKFENKNINKFNNSKRNYLKEKTLNEFFEEIVCKIPNNVAITSFDTSLTYSEYNILANKLARTLMDNGVSAGDVVVIGFEKSIHMMVVIMAIIKIGAAYLPLQPDEPIERLKYIIKDSNAKIILIQKQGMYPEIEKIVDVLIYDKVSLHQDGSNINNKFPSSNVAYIIYTSGSTGMPKGVMIRHYSVVNHILWRIEKGMLTEHDVFLQKTPYTFDVSVWEIFLWCFVGAKLFICTNGRENNVEYLLTEIERNKITVCQFVPSMLLEILKYAKHRNCISKLSSLRLVFSGGEVLHRSTVSIFFDLLTHNYGTKLFNVYGPTEATIDATCFDCSVFDEKEIPVTIPIGTPIWNTKVYIVDEENQLCEDGEVGEVCISGDGVAVGYVGNSLSTKSVFLPDPWDKGKIMYKTGDMGYIEDEVIKFCGRKDQQIKIRGMRVELEEIESVINSMEGIKQSVAIYSGNELESKLCAFYTIYKEVKELELRNFLNKWLPSYMSPDVLIKVDSMLYTSSGKIDRQKMLSQYVNNKELVDESFRITVQNVMIQKEKEIFDVICRGIEIKDINDISPYIKLNELGIDSIKFISLIILLEETFNIEFEGDMLLPEAYPNVLAMVKYVVSRIA